MAIEKEVPVYQLEDKTFRIRVKDKTGAPIDFSSGYDNIVILIKNADDSVFAKYSRTTTVGWKAIDTTDQATGYLSFSIESEDTNLDSLGKKSIEVLTRKTDATLTDGVYDSICTSYLFTLKKSTVATLTLP